MNEHLTGEITTDGKSLFVNLKLNTRTTDYSCVEYAIIKVLDYYGIVVRYENPKHEDDVEDVATSDLNFEIEGNDYPEDWTPGKQLNIRIMPINDDGLSMKYMESYFDERLAYYKNEPGIPHEDLLRYTKDWEQRQMNNNRYILNKHFKNPIEKPRIIKGDIVLGIKL